MHNSVGTWHRDLRTIDLMKTSSGGRPSDLVCAYSPPGVRGGEGSGEGGGRHLTAVIVFSVM